LARARALLADSLALSLNPVIQQLFVASLITAKILDVAYQPG
jgi:hypothetical protein